MSPGSTSEDFDAGLDTSEDVDVVLDFPAPFRGDDARPAIVEAIWGRSFGLGIEMGIVGVFYDSARSQRAAPSSQRRAKGLLFFIGVIPRRRSLFCGLNFLVMSGAPPWRWIA